MKRIFITTDVEKAADMYSNANHAERNVRVEIDFADLTNGKEYTYDNDFKLIVLDDTFINWTKYQINKSNDYILYHTSSEGNVITALTTAFLDNHIQKSSHILGEFHDEVYRIIFGNDSDKPNKILNVLGFTNEQIEEKEILESKLNLLHQCLTPDDAKTATQIPNYHLIEVDVEDVKIKNESVIEYLAKQSDCFDEEGYIKPLTTLRDKLLA